MSHTKGPWEHKYTKEHGRAVMAGSTPVVSTNSGWAFHASEEDGDLIAAAPDLLEALISLLNMDPDIRLDVRIERANAAIKKAKGET